MKPNPTRTGPGQHFKQCKISLLEIEVADLDIKQSEADLLIAMEKHRIDDTVWPFSPGRRIEIPLTSADKRERFTLDVNRSQIKLTKATYQSRYRRTIILLRLDLDGPPHRNPDGEEVPCPHLHIYREGFGDKVAVPAPAHAFPDPSNLFASLQAFMQRCNITLTPNFQESFF